MDNVRLYNVSKPYIAKVTCQSNIKSEPVDEQENFKDEHKFKAGPLETTNKTAGSPSPTPPPPPNHVSSFLI